MPGWPQKVPVLGKYYLVGEWAIPVGNIYTAYTDIMPEVILNIPYPMIHGQTITAQEHGGQDSIDIYG